MDSLYERLLDAHTRGYTHFATASEFLKACLDYFRWAEENPWQETHLFSYQGCISSEEVNKVRAFTLSGLAAHIGVPMSRFRDYRNRGDEWSDAMEMVDQIMHEQKFTAAAAGLLNASLIGRDLGLADKQEITGANGGPVEQVVQYQLPSNGRD